LRNLDGLSTCACVVLGVISYTSKHNSIRNMTNGEKERGKLKTLRTGILWTGMTKKEARSKFFISGTFLVSYLE
jgi:hypothetical protein